MPIRPIDVRRKEFRNSLRGYDANQVDDFLDAVADEFERAYTDNSRMREEIASLRERLQQFEELEGSIRAALVHAEQAADDLRRSATQEAEDLRRSAGREADLTIREAKARSHQILAESSARVERVQESYTALQEAKKDFANDFRRLLKTYMDTMENMEIASAREIEASLRERLDTESMAVAREAATYEGEAAGPAPAEPELAQETSGSASEEEVAHTTEDAPATQRIEPEESPQEVEEPEVEEPEAEPSFSSQEPDTEVESVIEERPLAEEPAAEEEVEREEPALAEESTSQGSSESQEGSESSAEEGAGESRIFRASRFLRRRDE
jgi:cell division initiation protein